MLEVLLPTEFLQIEFDWKGALLPFWTICLDV